MTDNYWTAPVFLLFLCALGASSYAIGFNNGEHFGTNQGIVYCIEKQKECKIKYDYLKLENQK